MFQLKQRLAQQALLRGGVIAYPTEGVWGFGCDPWDEVAVNDILAIKGRPVHKGLILVCSDSVLVEPMLAQLPSERRQEILTSWPGPNTWLLPNTLEFPQWISGQHSSVAIRVSAHPLVKQLSELAGGFLVSTSANFSGRPAATNIFQVQKQFKSLVDYVVPGATLNQQGPSTIRDAFTGHQIR